MGNLSCIWLRIVSLTQMSGSMRGDVMDTAYYYTSDDFPPPRAYEHTYDQHRLASFDRAIYMSRIKKDRKNKRILSYVLIAAVALVFALSFGIFLNGNAAMFINDIVRTEQSQSSGDNPTSTPRNLWTRGLIPYLYQTDAEWAAAPYADGTIATHGCGPTCLSMVYVQLIGRRDMDPAAMASFSETNGYIDAGVTSWLLMSEGARKLGLKAQEISADESALKNQLREGRPIICSVGPGAFTTDGHFIVICGLDGDGNFLVHDPNSPQNSKKSWDPFLVISQARNFWAYSA